MITKTREAGGPRARMVVALVVTMIATSLALAVPGPAAGAQASPTTVAENLGEIVAALESYAEANGTYSVANSGAGGLGKAWFWMEDVASYDASVGAALQAGGHLRADATGDSRSVLVYPCQDRVAVFADDDGSGVSDPGDVAWWEASGCTQWPLTRNWTPLMVMGAPLSEVWTDPAGDVQLQANIDATIGALESHAAATGTYVVDGSGQDGVGKGWLWLEDIGAYGPSIGAVLQESGHLSADASGAARSLLVFPCRDRVAVFGGSDGTVTTVQEDADWWSDNSCNPWPLSRNWNAYFAVSEPLASVVPPEFGDAALQTEVAAVRGALEAYAADNGTYAVEGAGQAGEGKGWFWLENGGSYSISIGSVLQAEGYLDAEAGGDARSILVFPCNDRIGVFGGSNGTLQTEPEAATWWQDNDCNPWPIERDWDAYLVLADEVDTTVTTLPSPLTQISLGVTATPIILSYTPHQSWRAVYNWTFWEVDEADSYAITFTRDGDVFRELVRTRPPTSTLTHRGDILPIGDIGEVCITVTASGPTGVSAPSEPMCATGPEGGFESRLATPGLSVSVDVEDDDIVWDYVPAYLGAHDVGYIYNSSSLTDNRLAGFWAKPDFNPIAYGRSGRFCVYVSDTNFGDWPSSAASQCVDLGEYTAPGGNPVAPPVISASKSAIVVGESVDFVWARNTRNTYFGTFTRSVDGEPASYWDTGRMTPDVRTSFELPGEFCLTVRANSQYYANGGWQHEGPPSNESCVTVTDGPPIPTEAEPQITRATTTSLTVELNGDDDTTEYEYTVTANGVEIVEPTNVSGPSVTVDHTGHGGEICVTVVAINENGQSLSTETCITILADAVEPVEPDCGTLDMVISVTNNSLDVRNYMTVLRDTSDEVVVGGPPFTDVAPGETRTLAIPAEAPGLYIVTVNYVGFTVAEIGAGRFHLRDCDAFSFIDPVCSTDGRATVSAFVHRNDNVEHSQFRVRLDPVPDFNNARDFDFVEYRTLWAAPDPAEFAIADVPPGDYRLSIAQGSFSSAVTRLDEAVSVDCPGGPVTWSDSECTYANEFELTAYIEDPSSLVEYTIEVLDSETGANEILEGRGYVAGDSRWLEISGFGAGTSTFAVLADGERLYPRVERTFVADPTLDQGVCYNPITIDDLFPYGLTAGLENVADHIGLSGGNPENPWFEGSGTNFEDQTLRGLGTAQDEALQDLVDEVGWDEFAAKMAEYEQQFRADNIEYGDYLFQMMPLAMIVGRTQADVASEFAGLAFDTGGVVTVTYTVVGSPVVKKLVANRDGVRVAAGFGLAIGAGFVISEIVNGDFGNSGQDYVEMAGLVISGAALALGAGAPIVLTAIALILGLISIIWPMMIRPVRYDDSLSEVDRKLYEAERDAEIDRLEAVVDSYEDIYNKIVDGLNGVQYPNPTTWQLTDHNFLVVEADGRRLVHVVHRFFHEETGIWYGGIRSHEQEEPGDRFFYSVHRTYWASSFQSDEVDWIGDDRSNDTIAWPDIREPLQAARDELRQYREDNPL